MLATASSGASVQPGREDLLFSHLARCLGLRDALLKISFEDLHLLALACRRDRIYTLRALVIYAFALLPAWPRG